MVLYVTIVSTHQAKTGRKTGSPPSRQGYVHHISIQGKPMSAGRLKVWAMAAVLLAAGAAQAGDTAVNRGAYVLSAEQSETGPLTVVFESGFGQGKDVWKIASTRPR